MSDVESAADLGWLDAIRPLTEPVLDFFADIEVWTARTTFAPFVGEPINNHAYDCDKQGSLVAGPGGRLSCAEVELVRRFRASNWDAGWTATCGQRNDDWRGAMFVPRAPADPTAPVPPLLPGRLASILLRHGTKGHPDVMAWQSLRHPRLVELKGPKDRSVAQADWLREALAAGTIARDDFLLVQWSFA